MRRFDKLLIYKNKNGGEGGIRTPEARFASLHP